MRISTTGLLCGSSFYALPLVKETNTETLFKGNIEWGWEWLKTLFNKANITVNVKGISILVNEISKLAII